MGCSTPIKATLSNQPQPIKTQFKKQKKTKSKPSTTRNPVELWPRCKTSAVGRRNEEGGVGVGWGFPPSDADDWTPFLSPRRRPSLPFLSASTRASFFFNSVRRVRAFFLMNFPSFLLLLLPRSFRPPFRWIGRENTREPIDRYSPRSPSILFNEIDFCYGFWVSRGFS